MAWFKLYAGLGGSFGGGKYQGTFEFDDIDVAQTEAAYMAIDEYMSYEGSHGLMNWEDCRNDLIDSFSGDQDDEHPYLPTDEEVDAYYQDEIEGWIDYWVISAEGPDDCDEY